MADEKKTILLNGGREVNVTLVTKAYDFLTQLLGGAPAKSGMATLQVVKNTAGKPFVAVLIGGKHVGFLSDSDAQELFPTLGDCEQSGVVAQAKGTVTASPEGMAQPTFRLSLAESGQLIETRQVQEPAPPAEAPKVESMPNQYCCTCGKGLPAGAKFCLECGTPVVGLSAPSPGAALPAPVLPVAPSVAPLPGPVAPRAQFSGTPTKGRGWWGRRNTAQKVGVVAGAVVVLVIVASVAVTAGDKDKEAVVSSATTVATATTATPVGATTATTAVPTSTTEAPTTTTTTAKSSFVDGVLTTPEMIIKITDVKTIPAGATGNKYGEKPVIAFWYEITNLTDDHVSPMNWIYVFSAYQDNNPNAVNELRVASLPDPAFRDSQTERIKKGGTVANATAYELDDETTPVDLVASEAFGLTDIGTMTYNLQ